MPNKQLYRAIYKHLAHKSDSVHKPGDYQHIPPADTGTSPGWRWHIQGTPDTFIIRRPWIFPISKMHKPAKHRFVHYK